MKSSYLQALLLLVVVPAHSQAVHNKINLGTVRKPAPIGDACIPKDYNCLVDGKYSPPCCGGLSCLEVPGIGGHFKCSKEHQQLEERDESRRETLTDELTEFQSRRLRRPARECVDHGDFCSLDEGSLGCCDGSKCISIGGSAFNTRFLPELFLPTTRPKDLEKNKIVPRADNSKESEDVCIARKQACRGTAPKLSSECCGYPIWQCMKQTGGKLSCVKPDFYGDGLAWPSGYVGKQNKASKRAVEAKGIKAPINSGRPRMLVVPFVPPNKKATAIATPPGLRKVATATATEEKTGNVDVKSSQNKHREDAKVFRRYDILRKCHQAKDRCRFDDQCCINLECVREKPKDKYGRCKNIEEW